MSENKEVIIWIGGKYTLKEGETVDSVMIAYNEECFDLELNITKITDLKGNNLIATIIPRITMISIVSKFIKDVEQDMRFPPKIIINLVERD